MGTTLSLGWFTPGHLHFCHIGDSRIYYLPRGGELLQLTDDHSHVGWLRRAGRLNEREARTHPGRSSLQQALGAGNQVIEPQVGRVRLAPGDRFLFCSDGLIEGLWDFRLADMLARDPEAAMEPTLGAELVEMAVAASGRDNTTAIVVEAFRQG
ncbi:MAG: serine/threonine-protein phosphatase [Akkermansiaceae bacterium]|nr:serine/threonine-protein phosphatase [Akkermansiaceae bacterium]